MEVFDTPEAMREWSDGRHRLGTTIAFVPTMGALHDGHRALVDEARRHGTDVVVSIFVNRLQFNEPSDFDNYPKPFGDDVEACRRAGVAAVYAPRPETMYPPGFQTYVEPGRLAERFEGEHRPGHFRGVTTVVCKLFTAVRPDVAVFGQKDAQQLAIIARMSIDLDLGVRIVAMPTVREHDGVAMSSRNRRLSATERRAAACIWQGLESASALASAGESSATAIADAVRRRVEAEPAARIEYVAVVDPHSFEPIDHIGRVDGQSAALVVVAAWLGEVRLIDNIVITT